MNTRIPLAALAWLCLSCNNTPQQKPAAKDVSIQNVPTANITMTDSADRAVQFQSGDPAKEKQAPKQQQLRLPEKPVDWEKKIVKTANLNTEVKDYTAYAQKLEVQVKRCGGYISQEQQSLDEYKIRNDMMIKVPVERFETLVNELLQGAAKVNEKRINSEDVTADLVDGRSRLEAKKQVRLRYLELLKEARNMTQILEVQKEINGIQEDIESVEGRINLLQHSSAMSTINLSFVQLLDAVAGQAPSKTPGFLSQLRTAFGSGFYWVKEMLVALIGIWPLLLFIWLAVYVLRKKQMPKIH